jgi:hypothetical protein
MSKGINASLVVRRCSFVVRAVLHIAVFTSFSKWLIAKSQKLLTQSEPRTTIDERLFLSCRLRRAPIRQREGQSKHE